MTRSVFHVGLLAALLIAARPAPDPIITVDGVAAAAKLSPQLKAGLASRITALNAGLEKAAAAMKVSHASNPQPGARAHASMAVVHEECMKLYHEVADQLDPAQRAAFTTYLHEHMKAAGLAPEHIHAGGIMKHGAHVPGDG